MAGEVKAKLLASQGNQMVAGVGREAGYHVPEVTNLASVKFSIYLYSFSC